MKELDDKTQLGRLMIAANAKYPTIKIVADLARHLNVDHQLLHNWLKRGIPAKEIDRLAEEFDCELKWLKNKVGPMKVSKPAILITKRDQEIAEFNELLKQLDDDDFHKVTGVGQDLAIYFMQKKQ